MGEKWGDETASGEDAEAHAPASDRDSDWQRHRNGRASEKDGRRDRDETQRKTARRRGASLRAEARTQPRRKCAGESRLREKLRRRS